MSQMGVYGVGARRAARSSGASGSDTLESLSSGPMAYITGKQAFLQILKQEGVSVMFGNPGTTEQPLGDRLGRAEDGEIFQDLVEAHAPEPLADRPSRPGENGLADRAVEVHRAGLGRVAGKALGVGDVDRHDDADLAAPGVAGLAPADVVAVDEPLELADARRPHREKNRQPQASDGGVRLLGHRRDAERWMRLLIGLGDHAHVLELEVLALVREPVLGPRLAEDFERLVEPLLALAERDVEARVLAGQPASSHAEVQP